MGTTTIRLTHDSERDWIHPVRCSLCVYLRSALHQHCRWWHAVMTQALLRLSCLLTKRTERVSTSAVGQFSESDASALVIAYPCAIPSICLLNPTIHFHIVMSVLWQLSWTQLLFQICFRSPHSTLDILQQWEILPTTQLSLNLY